jgi:iron complex transport system substrate-binding protein
VAEEAGYPVDNGPEDESAEDAGFVTVSQERLGQLEADLIVVPDPGENAVSFGAEVFEDNPFWDQLPSVQAGQVLALPQSIYNGGTYLAAELLLRALREALT